MADGRAFQKQFVSMSALGRNFQLGDLYNYLTDQVVEGKQL